MHFNIIWFELHRSLWITKQLWPQKETSVKESWERRYQKKSEPNVIEWRLFYQLRNQGQGLQVEDISQLMRVKIIEIDTSLNYKNVLRAKSPIGKIPTFGTMHIIGHLLELKDNEVLMVKTTHNFVR